MIIIIIIYLIIREVTKCNCEMLSIDKVLYLEDGSDMYVNLS